MEKNLKTAVVSFGRMNPPTKGHAKLVDKVIAIAKQNNGVPMIWVSHSEGDKKNPLSYKTKIDFLVKASAKVVQNDKENKIKTPFDILKHLNGKYDRIIFVAGSDRVEEYRKKLTQYNGTTYNFESLEVVSAGQRDADSDDAVASISGTKMREFVKSDDFDSFKKGLFAAVSAPAARKLFDEIKAIIG